MNVRKPVVVGYDSTHPGLQLNSYRQPDARCRQHRDRGHPWTKPSALQGMKLLTFLTYSRMCCAFSNVVTDHRSPSGHAATTDQRVGKEAT
jgi:hypothetical protein